jgi:bacterioferritin
MNTSRKYSGFSPEEDCTLDADILLQRDRRTATLMAESVKKKRHTLEQEKTMKGNDKIIAKLNDLLSDELTAINQYMVHSEMCDNWGYEKLHKAIEKRAIDEMKHAERLIGRILFLEGKPVVSQLKGIHIGGEVQGQHKSDWSAEDGAVKSYNDGIRLAVEIGDNGSRELMESILKDEENHIDWIEAQLDQITQMGIQNYLVEQMD